MAEISRLFGVHTSIAGGLKNALKEAKELGCSTFQIFLQSPRVWKHREMNDEEITEFKKKAKSSGFHFFAVHCSYLISLLSKDESVRKKSFSMLEFELKFSDLIGASYYILHLRENLAMKKESQISYLKENLKEILSKVTLNKCQILIENSPFGDLFGNIELLKSVGDELKKEVPAFSGYCLDTAHLHSSGYSFNKNELELLCLENEEFFKEVKLIHLNDSGFERGKKIDRHEHLGLGKIGLEGLKNFLKLELLKEVPLILETPKKTLRDDEKNLNVLRKILQEDVYQ